MNSTEQTGNETGRMSEVYSEKPCAHCGYQWRTIGTDADGRQHNECSRCWKEWTASQIVTPEFAAWLETTSFAGIVAVGDQWDTTTAWPSAETMRSARQCFIEFGHGNLELAEQHMWDAQRSFV